MPKGKGYGKARSKFVPKKNTHKKRRDPKKGMPLSKEEFAIVRIGSDRPDSYAKYLSRERKRKR